MSDENPFAVLGLMPTLDAAQVKTAYFGALTRHAPHQDPEGFRRVRAAYESLMRPGGLSYAFATCPLDVAAELARYRERLDASIARALEAHLREAGRAEASARFVETTSRMTFVEALAAFGRPRSA